MFKYLILIFFFLTTVLSANPTFNDSDSVVKNFDLQYYLDETNSLKIEDILKFNKFKKATSKLSFGYKKDKLWLKIDFKNNSANEDFIISLGEFFYETANLYYLDKDTKNLIKKTNGLFIPIEKREIQNSEISFKFNSKAYESNTLYLELNAKYSYFGDISIYKENYIFKNEIINIKFFYIFMFGTLTIVILFNLFLGFQLKEIIYYYYVGYTLCIMYYLISISGLLVYINLQELTYVTYFITTFAIVFLILFSMEYLNVRKRLPIVLPIFKVLALLLIVIGLLSIFYYAPLNQFLNYLILFSYLLLIFTSLTLFIKGYRKAKSYLFAIILYFSFVIIYLLLLRGILDNNYLTRYGYLFTLYFEVVFFASMLAGRYNDIKDEQIKTKNDFINLKNNQNKLLSQEVSKQTAQLNESNTKLTNSLRERELLLREICHRVKNNFHMINGMLWFESKKHKDKDIFTELNNRINSMAKIHEHLLYNSKDLNKIFFDEYFKDLLSNIEQLYSNKNFSINYKVPKLSLIFEEALSLGIIINEIINNSIKYGKHLKNNQIDLLIKEKDGEIILTIKDQGKGLPDDYKKGLGLNLVDEFSLKLHNSNHKFSYKDGLIFQLNFKQGTQTW